MPALLSSMSVSLSTCQPLVLIAARYAGNGAGRATARLEGGGAAPDGMVMVVSAASEPALVMPGPCGCIWVFSVVRFSPLPEPSTQPSPDGVITYICRYCALARSELSWVEV